MPVKRLTNKQKRRLAEAVDQYVTWQKSPEGIKEQKRVDAFIRDLEESSRVPWWVLQEPTTI